MDRLPGSVLFACSHNAIRSPMAEALMKAMHGRRVFVDSVGVHPVGLDAFAVAVLDELGIDLSRHRPKTFADLADDYFDLVVTLSPEAQHWALELTRDRPWEVEFWPMPDPSAVIGNRETCLAAYRQLRELLQERLRLRFPHTGSPGS